MATQAPAMQESGRSNGHLTAQELKGYLTQANGHHRFRGAFIRFEWINVFPQPRKTFEEIDNLAQNIAVNGIMEPPIIAKFTRKECVEYLRLLSHIWQVSLSIKDATSVTEEGEKFYYVLIAGERRCKSFKLLLTVGCQNCQQEFGEGPCHVRHFGTEEVEVRLGINMKPIAALFRQMAENTHHRVPPHEEAAAYARTFRLAKNLWEDMPLSLFAKVVGRGTDTIRNAIRFCELPEGIQTAVQKGQIPYGIAVEISRLHAAGVEEQELEWWLLRAVTTDYKVPDFRDVVTKYLSNQRSGQTSLLDIMDEEQRELLMRPHFRRVVQANTVQAMWAWIYYFGKVFQLFEEGLLGKEDSPFSERSPVRIFRKLLDRLEQVLLHLEQFLPEKEYPKRVEMFKQAQRIAQALEERFDAKETIGALP